ncbi:polysaccharide pyruvyl transferase family protein [Oligosphaera ethanolica]|uniref:Polysaccharide pyruvyl transferase domain-containing protein n=1 Tax=Oligosphaera ethanolica TaxID=760260 RepID=A0AAE3VG52_9BACT|nr:polysaccharide pyruvyl transferase family protein [Oligosphaera ethanolica]MDQ0289862.1 hypothetical protein [Oligosphaera ethanolica]
MAKVGIVTFHRSINYGAVLQAFALQNFLIKNGHDCELIDYLRPKKGYSSFSQFQKIYHGLWEKISPLIIGTARQNRTKAFREKYMQMSSEYYPSAEKLLQVKDAYSVCIAGSDQVWNPINTDNDSNYFLSFAGTKTKKISYAASFGLHMIPKKYHDEYRSRLLGLDVIGVRETEAVKIVKELSGRDAAITVDPTFLLECDVWEQLALNPQRKKPYILCYYIVNKPINEQMSRLAQRIQRETGWEIVKIGQREYHKFNPFETNIYNAGPTEFLGLMQNASMVISNSFHGCAFSIIYQRPFVCVTSRRHHLKSRLEQLMMTTGLKHQLLYIEDEDINTATVPTINYHDVNNEVCVQKQASIDFLLREVSV